ncbi:MAG: hypothetical protein E7451_08815 [Ruminococcaceae bacterium]|nr:hypothetical protein [Oscillospiraceae bacterium]
MNSHILMPILTISGIAIAAGYLLNVLEKAIAHKFDERQLIERGRGANLAMSTAMMYLLGLYMGYAFDLLRPEHWSIFAVYGLIVMMMVFDAHCIFHDAFQQRGEKLGTRILSDGLLGVLWLVTALQKAPWDPETAWINGAFALCWLSRSGMLLLRTVVLWIRDLTERSDEA